MAQREFCWNIHARKAWFGALRVQATGLASLIHEDAHVMNALVVRMKLDGPNELPLVERRRDDKISINIRTFRPKSIWRGHRNHEIGPAKITVLAEEAIPMTELDLAVLDQRIADAQDDEIAAKGDAERLKASQMVDDLKLVRAAF